MLQKKKKEKNGELEKKRSRCALFPSGQSWKGNWNISGLIKSRGNIIVNAWSLDPFHPVILIYSVHSVRGNRNFIEIKCISALAMEAGDKFLIALCTKGIVLTKDDMEKEREYESLTETFEKIVLIIYPTLIFPRVLVLSRSAVGKRMKADRRRLNDFFRFFFFFVPRGEIPLFREMRLYRMIS